jgi:hypothetical protein
MTPSELLRGIRVEARAPFDRGQLTAMEALSKDAKE